MLLRRACLRAALERVETIQYIPSDDEGERSRSPSRLRQPVNVSSGDEDEQAVSISDSDSSGNLKVFEYHFMEIFSPVRVARHIWRMNLDSCGSFDLIDGFDFRFWSDRARCRSTQDKHRPLFLMSSPPCTMYSELMRLWNLHKMQPEVRQLRQDEADLLLSFGMSMCWRQHIAKRFWAHEHPWKASSWAQPCAPWK